LAVLKFGLGIGVTYFLVCNQILKWRKRLDLQI